MTPTPAITSQPVWDRFVRFFHWALVASVLFNYFLQDDGKDVHQWVGYLAMSLVVARIFWGFFGSQHARFADFFPTPSRVTEHMRSLKSGIHGDHVGHNPLGALMMMALLVIVICIGVTGWMQTLDAYWGEEWLQDLHKVLANILIGMASLHVTAAVVMGRLERTRLIRAMVTGKKERW